MIAPGGRTGPYRTGGDQVLFGEQGKSSISAEDYAVAVVDVLDQNRATRERITVAS